MDFEDFKTEVKNQFRIDIDNYEDILLYIKTVLSIRHTEHETVKMAEKEYEKLVEENNKLLVEIGELKNKIKEGLK